MTPTTLKTITQFLEADECLENLHKIDNQDPMLTSAVATTSTTTSGINSGTTFTKLDSKSWQGGTTTVLTPSKCIPSMVTLIETVAAKEEIVEEIRSADDAEDMIKEMKAKRARRSAAKIDYKAMIDEEEMEAEIEVAAKPKRKSAGGRKPKNAVNVDPDEEQRVKIRRERNKEAAARCRKRRVDLTNSLMAKVEEQEIKKRALEEEIQQLKRAKEDLEFVLQSHAATCPLTASATQTTNNTINVVARKSSPVLVEAVEAQYEIKPERPTSLSLKVEKQPQTSPLHEAAQIPIETPTSVISHLAFEAVTTGLTPNAPAFTSIMTPTVLTTPTVISCAAQQRSNGGNNGDNATSSPEYVSL